MCSIFGNMMSQTIVAFHLMSAIEVQCTIVQYIMALGMRAHAHRWRCPGFHWVLTQFALWFFLTS